MGGHRSSARRLSVETFVEGVIGDGVGLAIAIALLLGLRHATDPDHLTAVSTLVLSDERATGRAGLLGLFWGLGHATTLFLFGLPLVLFQGALPDGVHRAAEAAIGILIAVLAVRLLLRWRREVFHVHGHAHDGVWHVHPHAHEEGHAPVAHEGAAPGGHTHPHAEGLGRSPAASYGIGLVHGVGGSAGTGVLMAAALPGRVEATVVLSVFALGTAISMAILSAAFGYGLAREGVTRRLAVLVPSLGAVGLVFGVAYALAAFGLGPLSA
jgi:cytochrome c biogenesis protein CcdA